MLSSIVTLLTLVIATQNATPDLATVIRRATSYVTTYEAALGNLIGTEDYVQDARWSSGRHQDRRTSSDFLIVRLGSDWVGLRDVKTVDGVDVRKQQQGFAETFGAMKAASAKYNIGDIMREANLPTFALRVLLKDEAHRFSFEKDGTEDVAGIETWRIRFLEKKGKTLVRDTKGKDLHSSGMLWVDPADGRVLKTEFDIENKLVKPPIHSSMVTTYAQGRKIELLVPDVMVEHYEAGENVIDCRAQYSDFRSFQVDVKLDFDSRRPPDR